MSRQIHHRRCSYTFLGGSCYNLQSLLIKSGGGKGPKKPGNRQGRKPSTVPTPPANWQEDKKVSESPPSEGIFFAVDRETEVQN